MYRDVNKFWFTELTPKLWFNKDVATDRAIRDRFADLHRQATVGELAEWRATPEGRLAEIIVLDQFSRSLYRGTPEAFAYDGMALILSQEAVRCNAQQGLTADQKLFLYLPHMHSESLAIHERAIQLFSQPGFETSLDFEMRHKDMIDRFGRYPYRNEILGRESTLEELEFLKLPGSRF